jgi:hypothetical protein
MNEVRTTSRSGKREGLAPLIVSLFIIPDSPSVARIFREPQELFPGISVKKKAPAFLSLLLPDRPE